VSAHLEHCEQCRSEAALWRELNRLVRAHVPQIDVPPFQWERIAARLGESGPKAGFAERIRATFRAHRLAWNTAMGAILVAGITLSGLEYHKLRQQEQLLPIVAYSAAEGQRLTTAGNPFRGYVESTADENPFARLMKEVGAETRVPPQ